MLDVIADTDQLINKLILILYNIFLPPNKLLECCYIFLFWIASDVMGVILHALLVKTITFQGKTSIAHDYVIVNQK